MASVQTAAIKYCYFWKNGKRDIFEGVQDCKQFQGELFGICNLFRDLSDKLFTSEIVELHEKQGQDHGLHHSAKQDSTDLGMYFVPSLEAGETFTSATSKANDLKRDTTIKPALEDLGIVYAHRNEHIVNYGPGTQGKEEQSVTHSDHLRQSCIPRSGERKLGTREEKEKPSSKTRKKSQYSLLAEFMGMEEVEFSKWLLSAAPAESERVLRDYKKREEQKRPDG